MRNSPFIVRSRLEWPQIQGCMAATGSFKSWSTPPTYKASLRETPLVSTPYWWKLTHQASAIAKRLAPQAHRSLRSGTWLFCWSTSTELFQVPLHGGTHPSKQFGETVQMKCDEMCFRWQARVWKTSNKYPWKWFMDLFHRFRWLEFDAFVAESTHSGFRLQLQQLVQGQSQHWKKR